MKNHQQLTVWKDGQTIEDSQRIYSTSTLSLMETENMSYEQAEWELARLAVEARANGYSTSKSYFT